MNSITVFIIIAAIIALVVGLFFIARRLYKWVRFSARNDFKEFAGSIRYYANKKLLRDHDFVASLWVDFVKDKTPNIATVAKIVAAATQVEKNKGRKFDGRPIRQGWMTEADFAAYFAFLDGFGSVEMRYRAMFQQTAYFKLKSLSQSRGLISADNLQNPVPNSALCNLAYEIRKSTIN